MSDSARIVRILIKVQKVIDFFLSLLFGYTTRYGWNKEKVFWANSYDMSAQVVSKV